MAIETKADISERFVAFIEQSLTDIMSQEFDKKVKELEDKKNEIVSGLVLGYMKRVSIDTMAQHLIIDLREIKND